MNREKIKKIVWEAVHEEVGELVPLTYDASLTLENLSYDSLDSLKLCMILEERFKVEITDAAWDEVASVGDIVTLIGGRVR